MLRSPRALCAMLVFAAAAAAAAASCRGCVRERIVVTRLLSREAANAVVVPAPSATLQKLRKLLGRFEGSSVGEQAKVVVQDLSGRLGFNPFDREGWLKAGLDPDKGLAVTLETVKKDGRDVDVPLFVIGVDDAGMFDKTVRRLAKEQERAELYRTQGYKQARITTILRQTPAGDRPLFAYAVSDGYAVFGDAAGGVDAIRRMVDRRLQNGLDSSPSYRRLLAKVRPGADAHLFVNENAGVDKVPVMSRRAAELFKAAREHFKGMLAALSIENGVALEVFLGLSDSAAGTAASYMAGAPKLAPAMLKTNSYDTLCHEHLEFYSLRVVKDLLERHGLRVVDVQVNAVNGGSFAVTACKKGASIRGNRPVIDWMLREEEKMGLHTSEPYLKFAERTMSHRDSLVNLINALVADGKKIAGYGASTKGNVLLQFCGLTARQISCIAEVNPDKYGSFTPGTNIPIVSEAEAKPWHFKGSILEREKEFRANGGKFIFPLPEIEIV